MARPLAVVPFPTRAQPTMLGGAIHDTPTGTVGTALYYAGEPPSAVRGGSSGMPRGRRPEARPIDVTVICTDAQRVVAIDPEQAGSPLRSRSSRRHARSARAVGPQGATPPTVTRRRVIGSGTRAGVRRSRGAPPPTPQDRRVPRHTRGDRRSPLVAIIAPISPLGAYRTTAPSWGFHPWHAP